MKSHKRSFPLAAVLLMACVLPAVLLNACKQSEPEPPEATGLSLPLIEHGCDDFFRGPTSFGFRTDLASVGHNGCIDDRDGIFRVDVSHAIQPLLKVRPIDGYVGRRGTEGPFKVDRLGLSPFETYLLSNAPGGLVKENDAYPGIFYYCEGRCLVVFEWRSVAVRVRWNQYPTNLHPLEVAAQVSALLESRVAAS